MGSLTVRLRAQLEANRRRPQASWPLARGGQRQWRSRIDDEVELASIHLDVRVGTIGSDLDGDDWLIPASGLLVQLVLLEVEESHVAPHFRGHVLSTRERGTPWHRTSWPVVVNSGQYSIPQILATIGQLFRFGVVITLTAGWHGLEMSGQDVQISRS